MTRVALSETGYGKAIRPVIVLCGAQAIYVGPGLGLSPHRNGVAVVAIGLETPLEIAIDATDANQGYRRCWSVLIAPNQLHHLVSSGTVGFIYLDPECAFARRQRRATTPQFDIAGTEALQTILARLWSRPSHWQSDVAALNAILDAEPAPRDVRVHEALVRLHADPANIDSATLAAAIGLSQSRFLHVFSASVGLPFRRYRLWRRLALAAHDIARGASLTDAALAAGFSSSSHFTSAFREMFGIAPSMLDLGRAHVVGDVPVR